MSAVPLRPGVVSEHVGNKPASVPSVIPGTNRRIRFVELLTRRFAHTDGFNEVSIRGTYQSATLPSKIGVKAELG